MSSERRSINDSIEDHVELTDDADQPAENDFYGSGYSGDYDEVDSDGEYVQPNYYGPTNLFEGLNFHFIGQFPHGDQCRSIVSQYGGEIKAAPSKKVDYVILGENPGLKRLEKIRDLGLNILNERGFFELIVRLSPHFRNSATPERVAGRDFERRRSPTPFYDARLENALSEVDVTG